MNGNRREFVTAAGATVAGSLIAQRARGANNRIALGFIGVGVMGQVDLTLAMRQPEVQVAAICDVYQPNLETAVAAARRQGHDPKSYKDFRDLLANQAIDAVCIAAPDHWHALMTVEACKAGKDVYVEKPACSYIDEAPKMVEAARKYKRVVQGGTQSRSSGHMQAIRDLIASGELGQVNVVHVWDTSLEPQDGIGNPPDREPPPGLDWNLWVGPAPMKPFNQNRFQTYRGLYSAFHYFWDYSGGQVSDRGVHLIDLVHMAFGEPAPTSAASYGSKKYLKDNRDVPDTQICLYEFPDFLMVYEHRWSNGQSMTGRGSGILVHGSKGTLSFGRPPVYQIYPEPQPVLAAVNPLGTMPPASDRVPILAALGGAGGAEGAKLAINMLRAGPAEAPRPSIDRFYEPGKSHWENFLECVRTRKKPIADIEGMARSTVTCLLGNVALRGRMRVDYEPATWASSQKEARQWMAYHYREPWKLEV